MIDHMDKVLQPIFKHFESVGLPPEFYPTKEAVVSKLLSWVDDSTINNWIEKYVRAMLGE